MGQILSPLELETALAKYHQLGPSAGGCIVSTNGCFDLLHVGHLRYLQAARKLGDILVVALNSDASVEDIKSPARPIVPEAERAELLSALDCVDYVVLFDAPSPRELLKLIRPHIHVKGGQYSEDTLPETPVLKEMGSKIVFLPMVDGRSTSQLIDCIVQGKRLPR
jgi:rfaE bifunctional protein nucleotidyltransferase chain/domain